LLVDRAGRESALSNGSPGKPADNKSIAAKVTRVLSKKE
jgi:hypothetical protein